MADIYRELVCQGESINVTTSALLVGSQVAWEESLSDSQAQEVQSREQLSRLCSFLGIQQLKGARGLHLRDSTSVSLEDGL